jgi:hypothetical protein
MGVVAPPLAMKVPLIVMAAVQRLVEVLATLALSDTGVVKDRGKEPRQPVAAGRERGRALLLCPVDT